MHSTCCCPRSIFHLRHHESGPGQEGRERPYLLAERSHYHSPPRDSDCPELGYGLPAVVVRPEVDGHLAAGTAGKKTKRRYREASPKHGRRRSMPETALERRDELEVGPGAADPVAAAGEGNTAGRLEEDTAQFGKTAQMTMVRLVLQKWGLGMCNHHRRPSLAAPLVRPVHAPDGGASSPRQQVGVGQRLQVVTRSNGDA